MDRERSSALQGEAEEVAGVEEAGWCHLTVSRSLWAVPCPGSVGVELGRRSAGAVPQVEGPGGGRPERSGEGQGEAGWLAAAAGLVEEGWEEEGYPAGLKRVRGEAEGGEVEAVEGEYWS